MKKLISLCIVVGLALVSALATDFDVMRDNLRREVFLGALDYDANDPAIQAHISAISKNAVTYQNTLVKNPTTYLWSEYDKLKGDRSYTCSHLYYSLMRLHTMALAWAYPTSSLYRDDTLLQDIKRSLDFLYTYALNEKTTLLGNFWEWRIGMPQEFAAIVSILYEQLSEVQIAHYDLSFTNFVRSFAQSGNLTFANQADICRNLLYMGILCGKQADITNALTCVKRAFVDETTLAERKKAQSLFEQMLAEQGDYHNYNGITKKEGFYSDGTFIQHIAMPYIGGYGSSMIQFAAEMQLCFSGTQAYTAPEYFSEALPLWIEKAYIPAVYKGEMMRMFMGRNTNAAHNPHTMGRAIGLNIYRCRNLIQDIEQRQRIINTCYSWFTDDAYYTSVYDGINLVIDRPHVGQMQSEASGIVSEPYSHIFAAGDRVVHETEHFRFGLAMSSNRIGKFEGFRNNNMSGWYTGDGMTYIYTPDNCDHWLNYFNSCNFYHMPGTTVDMLSRAAEGSEGMLFDNPVNAQAWVGGITLLGRYSAAGMSHVGAKSDLVAKKSWFMFDNEVHCLGAGISMSENRQVLTTIESRRINKGWSVDGEPATTKKCYEVLYNNPTYAYINEVGGYYFPEPVQLTTYIEQNKYYSLYIDHGKAPQNATYNYVLLPQMAEEDVLDYTRNPQTVTLSNTTLCQAVYHRSLGIVGINFWQAGQSASVTSDGEASVMYHQTPTTLYFAASDPTWKRTSQTFVLDGLFTLSSAEPADGVTLTRSDSSTTITINCADRMGQGQCLQLGIIEPLPSPEIPSAVFYTDADDTAVFKTVHDGVIYIHRNGHVYSVQGTRIK